MKRRFSWYWNTKGVSRLGLTRNQKPRCACLTWVTFHIAVIYASMCTEHTYSSLTPSDKRLMVHRTLPVSSERQWMHPLTRFRGPFSARDRLTELIYDFNNKRLRWYSAARHRSFIWPHGRPDMRAYGLVPCSFRGDVLRSYKHWRRTGKVRARRKVSAIWI